MYRRLLHTALCLTVLILPQERASAQTYHELQAAVENASHDSTRLRLLVDMTEVCPMEDIPSLVNEGLNLLSKQGQMDPKKRMATEGNLQANLAFYYCQNSDAHRCDSLSRLAAELNRKAGEFDNQAITLNNLAHFYTRIGGYDKAIPLYQKSIEIHRTTGNLQACALKLNNLAHVYQYTGAIDLALDLLYEARRIYTELEDMQGLSLVLLNSSQIHETMGDDAKALELLHQALDICRKHTGCEVTGSVYHNLGYHRQKGGKYTEALQFYDSALFYKRESGFTADLATTYINIGFSYTQLGEVDSALVNYQKGLVLANTFQDVVAKISVLKSRSILYEHLGDIPSMKRDLDSAHRMSIDLDLKEDILSTAKKLYQIHRDQGNMTEALHYLEVHQQYKDSLLSDQNRLAALQKEIEFGFRTKSQRDSLENVRKQQLTQAENAAILREERAEAAHKRNLLTGGIVGMLLLGGLALFAYLRKKKDSELIAQQKEEALASKLEVEEKNQEIQDSITYAQRIQMSMLPSADGVKAHFQESFVLYLPKDKLSGDFYWSGQVATNEGKQLKLLTVADCTGHGVPGALVSILGIAYVRLGTTDESVNSPASALDYINEGLYSILNSSTSGETVKDGMDIVMAAFDLQDMRMNYAAAMNPIYVVRDGGLLVLDSDRHSIGKSDERLLRFTDRWFDLQEGDCVYMFTDGLADQFGGPIDKYPTGKKFKYSRFKKLLAQHAHLPMQGQREVLFSEFNSWKGTFEQVDDVCVIGVRV